MRWKMQAEKIKNAELQQENQSLRNDINKCMDKIEALSSYIRDIDEKKLNITDFEEART